MVDLIAKYDEFLVPLRADDRETARKFFHPDFIVHEDPGMPYGGMFAGADAFIELRHKVRQYWKLDIESKCVSPEGDRLVIVIHLTGLADGPCAGLETWVTVVWSFRDGKALEARVLYYDTPTVNAAIRGT